MKISEIELSVKNLEESIEFYKNAFGGEVLFEGTNGIGKAARLQCGDLILGLYETPKIPVGIFGMVTDVAPEEMDASIEKLKENGAKVVMEPTQVGLGKIAKLFDPSEISISVAGVNFDSEDSGARVTHLPNKIK